MKRKKLSRLDLHLKIYFDVYQMACAGNELVLGRALNLCIYHYGISVLNTGRFLARRQNIRMQ